MYIKSTIKKKIYIPYIHVCLQMLDMFDKINNINANNLKETFKILGKLNTIFRGLIKYQD